MQEPELEKLTDRELVSSACRGDESAFEEILRRYGPRVFRIAGHFFREAGKVEDIAQEVFLRAFMHLSSFDGRGSLEGWLSKISTTVCLNAIRHSKSRPEILSGMVTEEESSWLEARLAHLDNGHNVSAEQSVLEADLAEKVLRALSPEDRLVLTLIDGEELSVREVSSATGWSEANVKVRAFRARRRMHRAVDNLLRRKPRNSGGPDLNGNQRREVEGISERSPHSVAGNPQRCAAPDRLTSKTNERKAGNSADPETMGAVSKPDEGGARAAASRPEWEGRARNSLFVRFAR